MCASACFITSRMSSQGGQAITQTVKPTVGICWTEFGKFAGNRGIMCPNGEAKKMRAEK